MHFPSQLQAPQACAAFSTQVLFRGTSLSAAELNWGYELAQCMMAAGCGNDPAPPQLADSELRSGSGGRSAAAMHMSSGLGYAQLANGNVLLLGPHARCAVGCECPAETTAKLNN